MPNYQILFFLTSLSSELEIGGGIEDNVKISFLISQ